MAIRIISFDKCPGATTIRNRNIVNNTDINTYQKGEKSTAKAEEVSGDLRVLGGEGADGRAAGWRTAGGDPPGAGFGTYSNTASQSHTCGNYIHDGLWRKTKKKLLRELNLCVTLK